MKEDKVRYLIEKEQVISDINIFRDIIKKDKYYVDKILYSPESLKLLRIFGVENMNYYETAHYIFRYYESRFDKFCKSYNSPNYGNPNYNAIRLTRNGIGATLNDILKYLIGKYEECLIWQVEVDEDYVNNREEIYKLTRQLLAMINNKVISFNNILNGGK